MMEIMDIYNRDRGLTGKTRVRGEALEAGEYRLVVHLCIFNSKGEMLIQERQPFKNAWPGKWDLSVGGCAVQGDTSIEAIKREAFEELGYRIQDDEMRPVLTINFDTGFDDLYVIQDDVVLDTLVLQAEEVRQVQWASKKALLEMIRSKMFVPYKESLIEILFEMNSCKGTWQKDTQIERRQQG